MTRTSPPPAPFDVGQTTTSPNLARPDRPGFTAELVDDDRGRVRVYRISDARGYTGREDTIRVVVRPGGFYHVETLRRDGWTLLLDGAMSDEYARPDHEAIARTFRVLYGEEDHG